MDAHNLKTERFHQQMLKKMISRGCAALFLLHSAFLRGICDWGVCQIKKKKGEERNMPLFLVFYLKHNIPFTRVFVPQQ